MVRWAGVFGREESIRVDAILGGCRGSGVGGNCAGTSDDMALFCNINIQSDLTVILSRHAMYLGLATRNDWAAFETASDVLQTHW